MKGKARTIIAAAIAIPAALAGLFFGGIAWWINSSDAPARSDMIVMLSGSYSRPFYAADLYRRGFAPEIWISQPKRARGEALLDEAGVSFPLEPRIHKEVLVKRGVPAGRIRFYGPGVDSTVDEAAALRRELGDTRQKILIVTSRYHVRRSRIVFRRYLPRAEIRVTATPYEDFLLRWWRDKDLSQNAILEAFKTAFYLVRWAGGTLPRPILQQAIKG